MRILGLDAATAACSAALLEDGSILAHECEEMEHGHAQALVPMILRVMAGRSFAELDGIGVTRGPGGFTGIRVALATARGLGLAASLPVLGVTCFAAVARAVKMPPDASKLLVLIQSRRRDVYAQLFAHPRQPLLEPAALFPEDLPAYAGEGALIIAGDAAVGAAVAFGGVARLAPGPGRPDAAMVATIAAEMLAETGPVSLPPPSALYLRAADVTLPKGRR